MKAILLAAGLGTRLKPLTNTIPKCLVPISGRPLLSYWLEKLANLGINEILINVHYLAEQVENYISQSPYRDKITIVKETALLGTGGTLKNNAQFWKDEEVIVIHADNFCLSDLSGLINSHNVKPAHVDMSLLLFTSNQPTQCGIVVMDADNVIHEFHEKVSNPPGNLASGALFVFSDSVYERYFKELKEHTFYDLSKDIVPNMIGKMQGWIVDDEYMDIGTPESYERAQKLI
ncbi:mannose-1-phosphate guanylyltransferase [Pseudoalteromonas porphyrae]|uniref:Mannose-1-phosphate guanylyltransferase n=1 Tax=Pseudoalteromonas porphyrae TaxID=187330 RepID=A0A0N0M0V4_9GAMM|nr:MULTISPECIES: nucleotidyltransferase family protein [Pseudoalteromonas]KPH63889.1 mannose-1-phosphate guanylyltransferase [Pseudoalteromonas porphyrae]KPH96360.1 mannose-1-phosphate guanylyltransferase [Pseudoalteromonas porphyrae]NNG42201.1 nucleotidyltransferase family protein [Pseudoalteromonas sp. NEC-BIFX-2020_002]